ncbi:MAG: nitrilase-related carbon-nitrogen hydrolase [Chthoniobacterales bacterium]
MKIAVAQIACALGDVPANVAKMRDFCARAKDGGAELIVFPEMADTGYSMSVIKSQAQKWSEGAVPALRETARALSLNIISGLSEREGADIYNSQVAIDAHGETVAKYRKAHLFAPGDEDETFRAGADFTTFPLGPWRVGLSICYDLRFPEVYRALAVEQGANVLVVSAAWPFPRVEHLRVLAVARAIENQSYVILSNRTGTDAGVTCCGSSAVIDPAGVLVAAASAEREELITAEFSPEVLKTVRARMAAFAHRRLDLYGR